MLKQMVAGRAGVLVALLFYGLLCNFISPTNIKSVLKTAVINPPIVFCSHGKIYGNYAGLSNQDVVKFGYGKHALAVSFIFPSLYERVKKRTKPATLLQLSHSLIITLFLL